MILISITGWIVFNPYIYCANSESIQNICFLMNDFCKNISLNYHFSNKDVFSLLRFLEYSILGITSAVLYRKYFNKIWANITNLLFFGLIVPVVEVLYRSNADSVFSAQDILISFFEFCLGAFIILICCVPKNKRMFSSRYKKNRYTGRG